MKHFPIFLAVEGKRIVVSGGGEAALAKLRLLAKTQAQVTIYAESPSDSLVLFVIEKRLSLARRALQPGDVAGATLFYGANEDAVEDARVAAIAAVEGALVNIVDNLDDSAFITPAIVDRDPVTVAIGTEGAAPVLARAIKRDLEERLPARLGLLARIGKKFRPLADKLPMGRARRNFWAEYYFTAAPRIETEDQAEQALDDLLHRHLEATKSPGFVDFVGAGPGDPDLLTMKARRALDGADVVIYDRLIAPDILELARREAVMIEAGKTGFGPSTSQATINDLIVSHAAQGAQVVRLKSGDPTVFGRLDEEIEAVTAAGIDWRIVPGITAASAAVAAIGQSMTQRGRNAEVRIVTGHDMAGYAEQDWRALAAPGAVAAIYMGKKSARFIQGRLMMHGAAPDTPVTTIVNASRADQRICATNLGEMAQEIADLDGPALTFIGLSPRDAMFVAEQIEPQEIAR